MGARAQQRFERRLFALFGLTALALAAICGVI
jgi:hypothetical protein